MDQVSTAATNGSFSEKVDNESTFIKEVNKKLTSGERVKGLRLVEKAVGKCSNITFTSNCVKWLQCCCKTDVKAEGDVNQSYKTFGCLITKSTQFPELGRAIAQSVTSRFLDVFLKKLKGWEQAWEMLELLMTAYSGSLVNSKDVLEGIMMESLQGNMLLPVCQARCFALIPSLGGSGVKGINYKSSWRELFDELLSCAHLTLSYLFKDVTEMKIYDPESSSKFSVSEDAPFADLVLNLRNICRMIQYMLLGKYPAAKMIPADSVMDVVFRGLSVSSISLGKKKLSRITELSGVLPLGHGALINVLTALFVCCGRTLLSGSSVIAKILEQGLEVARGNVNLRVEVYSCLSNWMLVARGGSCVQGMAKTLVPVLLSDIRLKNPTIVLQGKKGLQNLPKSREEWLAEPANEILCVAAMKTLEILISSNGFLLSSLHHKMLQSAVIQLATDLDRRPTVAHVYSSNGLCRSALYAVLIQLCLEPNPNWPPPTQFALKLLRTGLDDLDPTVSATCSSGISMLERIIHPEFSVASFPKDLTSASSDKDNQSVVDISYDTISPPKFSKLVGKTTSPWESILETGKTSERSSDKEIQEVTSRDNCANKREKKVPCEIDISEEETKTPVEFVVTDDSSGDVTEVKEPEKKKRRITVDSEIDVVSKFSEESRSESPEVLPLPSTSSSPERKPSKMRLRARTPKPLLDIDVNVNSPMELRSGVLLKSPSGSSQTSSEGRHHPPTTASNPTTNPSSPCSDVEDDMLFDVVVRDDYK